MLNWLVWGGKAQTCYKFHLTEVEVQTDVERQVKAMIIAPQLSLMFLAADLNIVALEKLSEDGLLSFEVALRTAYSFVKPRAAVQLAQSYLRGYAMVERNKNEGFYYHLFASLMYAASATDRRGLKLLRYKANKMSRADILSDEIIHAIITDFESHADTVYYHVSQFP